MLLISARGERGGDHWTMTAIEAGDMPLPEAGPEKPTALGLRRAHAWLLRHSTRLVEIARLPTEQQTAQVALWDAASRNAPWEVRWLIVSGPKIVAASLRNQAVLRSAAAAVAAERYRRAQGRWPASLADLIPAQLREVPADPYDGAPLRYRRLDDGVVIYSVGPDGKDDGGVIDWKDSNRVGADIGFRLWDVAQGRRRRSRERA